MPARTCRACSAASSVGAQRNRMYRWDDLPEQRAWMMEHGAGRPIAEVRADFEERFGTPITRGQVTTFRQKYGLARRNANRSAHSRSAPIGSECKVNGYTKIKVRELPSRRGLHDNWVLKHRVVWERAHGCEVPEDVCIMFADGDKGNFDPDNLVAVPRKYTGPLNNSGLEWHDADGLRAALALVMLKTGTRDAINRPRRCGVCGRMFTPDRRPSSVDSTQQTCRECLDKGLMAPRRFKERTVACAVCGKVFTTTHTHQKYCCKKCQDVASYRARKERNGK